MFDRKSLTWFLGITLAISWPLFFLPLLLKNSSPAPSPLSLTGLWALAMWGPGLAAILTTALILKQPFRSLHLNRLGPKRYYLWAWLLPIFLSATAGLFTILLGLGKYDANLTLIRETMAAAPGSEAIPPLTFGLIASLQGLIVGPLINTWFALGEELGWRGFLLPRLLPLGQWKAILVSGIIWGLWHTPAIVQGLNYPGYPVAGIFMMVIFCVLLGAILSWLYLSTHSPWAPALGHAMINATAAAPVMFLTKGLNIAFGGTIASVAGWIGLALFILWLIWSKQLPVPVAEESGESTI